MTEVPKLFLAKRMWGTETTARIEKERTQKTLRGGGDRGNRRGDIPLHTPLPHRARRAAGERSVPGIDRDSVSASHIHREVGSSVRNS